MENPIRGNEFRRTTVCVDSYENSVMTGRFYNQYLSSSVEFHSLLDFLTKMEEVLDDMKFPQAFKTYRSFGEDAFAVPFESVSKTVPKSLLASFEIRILFRQNASWQGSVTWIEGKQEQSFRSTLELIFLMNSAILAAGKCTLAE